MGFIKDSLKTAFMPFIWKKAQRFERKYWVKLLTDQPNLHESPWYPYVLSYFGLTDGYDFGDETVVDIGAGPVCALSRVKALQRIAVDPLDYDSLDGTIERIKAQGENTTLPPETAHRVLMYNVLQHVQSPERVLHEVARILKPAGKAYILEQLDEPPSKGHPHMLKLDLFERWVEDNDFMVCKKQIDRDKVLTSVNPDRPGCGVSVLCLIVEKK